jgi:hypothetical protein
MWGMLSPRIGVRRALNVRAHVVRGWIVRAKILGRRYVRVITLWFVHILKSLCELLERHLAEARGTGSGGGLSEDIMILTHLI